MIERGNVSRGADFLNLWPRAVSRVLARHCTQWDWKSVVGASTDIVCADSSRVSCVLALTLIVTVLVQGLEYWNRHQFHGSGTVS